MADKKLRVIGWQVQLLAMADDGESLETVNVQPVTIPVKQWEEFKNGGDERAVAMVEAQVNPVVPP